ncbi:MAG: NAD(P)-dependent oxidoreductase [Alphaproteobacteria bacterium]|nr:NAD(P)-dependent oxidoreductase [Alphaproteobacteria bacterium]
MTSASDAPVLVVGGRGFVGAATVRHLLSEGRRVAVFGPAGTAALPDGAAEIIGTIERPEEIAAALAATGARRVASFAAYSSGTGGLARAGEEDPERAIAVNVLGFRRLLEACAAAGVPRVVWTSSTVVFGTVADPGRRVAEDAPRRPAGVYGLTKLLAEEVAAFMSARHGIETVALRIPLMLGPGLWYDGAASPLKRLVAAAAAGTRAAETVAAGAFDAMHVADLGRLVGRALDAPPGLAPAYNVAGFTTSYRDVVATLAALRPGFAADLTAADPGPAYPLQDQGRLERDLGFACAYDLRAVLHDMLEERSRRP